MSFEPACPLLTARAVSVWRGTGIVCELDELVLPSGRGVWLRGRNGSGKTSLLRVLAGLSPPASGVIDRAQGANTMFVGHANALKDELTVTENLKFLSAINTLDCPPGALRGALEAWGLWSRRHVPVRRLSQGLKRRVALARLELAACKKIWLLDEPFDALDDESVNLLCHRLVAHLAAGGALALTSHNRFWGDTLTVNDCWLGKEAAS